MVDALVRAVAGLEREGARLLVTAAVTNGAYLYQLSRPTGSLRQLYSEEPRWGPRRTPLPGTPHGDADVGRQRRDRVQRVILTTSEKRGSPRSCSDGSRGTGRSCTGRYDLTTRPRAACHRLRPLGPINAPSSVGGSGCRAWAETYCFLGVIRYARAVWGAFTTRSSGETRPRCPTELKAGLRAGFG